MTLQRVMWSGLAVWVILIALSGVALTAEPTGDGFVRGMNRVTGFLGWQFVAAVLSVVLWVFGRSLPRETPVRWAVLGTICWSVLLILVIVGWIAYGIWLGGSPG